MILEAVDVGCLLMYEQYSQTAYLSPRSDHWWNLIVLQTFTDRNWSESFCMSRESFTYLCEQLSTLRKKNTFMHQSLSVEKRVAITL